MAQLMPLPPTVSCFSKIQIGFFTFLVLAHLGSPGQRAVKRVCVCYSCNLKGMDLLKVVDLNPCHLHLLPPLGGNRISLRSLESENYELIRCTAC